MSHEKFFDIDEKFILCYSIFGNTLATENQ